MNIYNEQGEEATLTMDNINARQGSIFPHKSSLLFLDFIYFFRSHLYFLKVHHTSPY